MGDRARLGSSPEVVVEFAEGIPSSFELTLGSENAIWSFITIIGRENFSHVSGSRAHRLVRTHGRGCSYVSFRSAHLWERFYKRMNDDRVTFLVDVR